MSRLRLLSCRLLDAAYPRVCPVCDSFHERDGDGLCDRCRGALNALGDEPYCPRCAKPVATPGAPCPWCLGRGVRPYERVLRLGEYEDPLRKLILDLKYRKHWTAGEALADAIAGRPEVVQLMRTVDVIVPVPLHFRRQYSRGYNQAEVVARRLARRFKKKLMHPAKRTRNTETQTRLTSMKARQDNLRGAFALRRPRTIQGMRVLVIDDVLTTGATIRSLGRVLLGAKPAGLSALVIAVADPKRRDFQSI